MFVNLIEKNKIALLLFLSSQFVKLSVETVSQSVCRDAVWASVGTRGGSGGGGGGGVVSVQVCSLH